MRDITYLIVASPDSPHSQLTSNKLRAITQQPLAEGLRHIKIVWEGWAREAMKYGRIRPERLKLWEWKPGGLEPTEIDIMHADSAQTRIRDDKRSPLRAEDSMALSTSLLEIYGPNPVDAIQAKGGDKRAIDSDGRLIVVATTKARVKLGNRAMSSDSLSLDNVLSSYRPNSSSRTVASASTKPNGRVESSLKEGSKRKDSTKAGRLAMIAAEPIEPVMGRTSGASSVIQALSTSRSAAMTAPTPLTRKILNPPALPTIQGTPNLDSTLTPLSITTPTPRTISMQSPPPASAEKYDFETPLPVFQNVKFALVDLGDQYDIVTDAITEYDGQITMNEDEADWICVRAIK
jgi:hypothetical protein